MNSPNLSAYTRFWVDGVRGRNLSTFDDNVYTSITNFKKKPVEWWITVNTLMKDKETNREAIWAAYYALLNHDKSAFSKFMSIVQKSKNVPAQVLQEARDTETARIQLITLNRAAAVAEAKAVKMANDDRAVTMANDKATKANDRATKAEATAAEAEAKVVAAEAKVVTAEAKVAAYTNKQDHNEEEGILVTLDHYKQIDELKVKVKVAEAAAEAAAQATTRGVAAAQLKANVAVAEADKAAQAAVAAATKAQEDEYLATGRVDAANNRADKAEAATKAAEVRAVAAEATVAANETRTAKAVAKAVAEARATMAQDQARAAQATTNVALAQAETAAAIVEATMAKTEDTAAKAVANKANTAAVAEAQVAINAATAATEAATAAAQAAAAAQAQDGVDAAAAAAAAAATAEAEAQAVTVHDPLNTYREKRGEDVDYLVNRLKTRIQTQNNVSSLNKNYDYSLSDDENSDGVSESKSEHKAVKTVKDVQIGTAQVVVDDVLKITLEDNQEIHQLTVFMKNLKRSDINEGKMKEVVHYLKLYLLLSPENQSKYKSKLAAKIKEAKQLQLASEQHVEGGFSISKWDAYSAQTFMGHDVSHNKNKPNDAPTSAAATLEKLTKELQEIHKRLKKYN